MSRLVLAATLGANYGIYGPAFELGESRRRRGERRVPRFRKISRFASAIWTIPNSLGELIAQVNRIRRENLALHSDWSLRFHPSDNAQVIVYSKMTDDLLNIIVVVVNLDPDHTQAAWVDLPLEVFHLDPRQPYQVHDLLTDARYVWRGPRNWVHTSDPLRLPAHIFCIRRRVRTEAGIDYFAF